NGQAKSEIIRGGAFGENVVLLTGAQSSTIRAKGNAEAYGMSGASARKLFVLQHQQKHKASSGAVNDAVSSGSCWLLQKLTPYQIQRLFDA
ncbi:unnamed protein product, partial [Polarella glacialis]